MFKLISGIFHAVVFGILYNQFGALGAITGLGMAIGILHERVKDNRLLIEDIQFVPKKKETMMNTSSEESEPKAYTTTHIKKGNKARISLDIYYSYPENMPQSIAADYAAVQAEQIRNYARAIIKKEIENHN